METKPTVMPEVATPPAVKETADKLRHKLIETSAKAPQFVQTYVCKLCHGQGHVITTTSLNEIFLRCEKCNRSWVEKI
jgi:cellobiose-specific phosphotransferase system component IIA